MRILYDARSVRTAAGMYVFGGLTAGWLADSRVSGVIAAIPRRVDASALPPGVEPLRLGDERWISHVVRRLPRCADFARADVIFSPNATPPRDARAVLYFQDLIHFRALDRPELFPMRIVAAEVARAMWRRLAAPRCLLGVAVSSEIETEVRERVALPCVLIPNGVDVSGIRWTGSDDRVVVLGGVGERKNEGLALRAWARVAPATGDTSLEILGAGPESRRAALVEQARALGLAARVTVRGAASRDEFLERIATARLAVSCSTLEAFGLPVAEALAMGAPVLCSDIPSHAELIRRARAGETFPVDDAGALSARILRALEGDLPSRLSSSPQGWTWAARAQEHVSAYTDAIARRAAGPIAARE